MSETGHTRSRWADARLAAALLAIDPGLRGAVVTARAGPVRDAWLEHLRGLMPDDAPWRRIPANIGDEALLGGLDLAATLKRGQAVRQPGLLDQIQGGVGVLAMAERADTGLAARLSAALDRPDAPILIALDEAVDVDESAPDALRERLALHLDLSDIALGDITDQAPDIDIEMIAMARMHLPHVINAGAAAALTKTAAALGIDTLRAPLLALQAARAAAALAGLDEVGEAEAALAARLVLAPRATQIPAREAPEEAEPDSPPPDPEADARAQDRDPDEAADDLIQTPDDLTEVTLDAAQAAIPPGLLVKLQMGAANRKAASAGRAGAAQKDGLRGRPAGVRRGDLASGKRLDVLATLRAAAPWGKARRKGWARLKPGRNLEVRKDDFRVKRFKQKAETATIFVVDASGSLALHRLAEAKGAVELMLAESYVRRDQVAVIAFRGQSAETLLPPTRSLTRAKRSLAALPGGGGTPLASAIEAAEAMAHAEARHGRSVTLVFLTDGAANIGRDGQPGRERAQAEAHEAAKRLRARGHAALVVDVSKRGTDAARTLAAEMDARYVRLPAANSGALAGLAREMAA